MIITSNKRVSEWAELFGDEVQAVAILDRLLHDAEILTINGPSWRLRGRGDLLVAKPHPAEDGETSPTDIPPQRRQQPQNGSHEADSEPLPQKINNPNGEGRSETDDGSS